VSPDAPPLPRVSADALASQQRDRMLVDAGADGERLVARIRILLLCLLLLVQAVPSPDPLDNLVGFSLNVLALAAAFGIFFLAAYRYRPWLAFASSGIDVSLVTLGLVGFFVVGKPETAVNSKVVFELYFLAIGCASLRYDWRICAMSGALAVAQYSAIVAYAWRLYGVGAQPAFGWNVQVGRVIVLIAAALISVAAVLRAQRLRLLSITDRLTGVANRGFFDQRLAEEESRARRYGHPFAIAIVDVDYFKRFNDTYGHVAGDRALQTLAETLRSSVRRSDVVARYGGEEFALILPETGLEEAAHKIELIRRLVTAAEVAVDARRMAKLDISGGVAEFPRDGGDARSVLAAADARLYEAKHAGRGRVISGLPRFST
jgi:diguanylate cyclase (GGDEF)-like protein